MTEQGVTNEKRSLDAIATDIRKLERRKVFEIGKLLTEARDDAQHGEWMEWLEEEFDWSAGTASNYMAAHELATKFPIIVNLPLPMVTIYGLCGEGDLDDTGLSIVIAALEKATKGGKKITVADADHVIRTAKLRIEYGDYPEATLEALDTLSFGDTTWATPAIERLKTERPETPEAAEQIIAAMRRTDPTEDEEDAEEDDAASNADTPEASAEAMKAKFAAMDGETKQPSRAEVAKLVRPWVSASPEAKREFVRERWDEIALIRKRLDANGAAAEDRWIEGDGDYDNRTRKSAQ